MDQGSNKNHSPAYNFTPTVTKFCVMWEGLSLPHDTKFGNCRCKIVDNRSFHSWSLIHGLRWSGLIKVVMDGAAILPPSLPVTATWELGTCKLILLGRGVQLNCLDLVGYLFLSASSPNYYSDLTLSQSFQAMAAQLSMAKRFCGSVISQATCSIVMILIISSPKLSVVIKLC